MPTLATPTPTTARGRLRPSPRLTPPWCTAPVLSATPTLLELTPSPTPELPTPLPTLPSASPTPPTLASAPTTSEPLCRAAGRGRLTPPCSTPASTAPTPSTPSPTLPPDSPTPPTSESAPTTSEPSFLADCLTLSLPTNKYGQNLKKK